jgi:hypothetical protein
MALLGCRSGVPEPSEVGATAHATHAAEPARVKRDTTGEATLLLMADIRGVLRPCGCTVELQKGGFDRLLPVLKRLRTEWPESALLHAGPLFFEEADTDATKAAQRERQAEVVADLVARVGVRAAGVTGVDLTASNGRFEALADRARVHLTAANLTFAEGSGKGPEAHAPRPEGADDSSGSRSGGLPAGLRPAIVEKIGGLHVGIFALASPAEASHLEGVASISDPVEAARAIVADLQGRADIVVLLSALGLRDTKRLVRKVPGVHFAVAGGMGEHPAFSDEAEPVGGARVVQFHREGRFLGRLTVRVEGGSTDFVDASAPSAAELAELDDRIAALDKALKSWKEKLSPEDRQVRSAQHHLASLREERERLGALDVTPPSGRSSFSFRLVQLPWDLPQDPEILSLMDAFDEELKKINLAHAGTLPEPKPGEAVYVGVETCLECHDETQAFWDDTRHSHAWETLEKLGKTFDAECVSCHVTGYGKAGGSILGQTKGREDVQCESCHGPGSLHVDAETDEDYARTIVKTPPEDNCTVCHNKHHSPHFEYRSFFEKLRVPGHGKPVAGQAP